MRNNVEYYYYFVQAQMCLNNGPWNSLQKLKRREINNIVRLQIRF
jgi:hypothetical protein